MAPQSLTEPQGQVIQVLFLRSGSPDTETPRNLARPTRYDRNEGSFPYERNVGFGTSLPLLDAGPLTRPPPLMRNFSMSDFIPKAGAVKIGGLSRAAQKLQSAREKAAQVKTGAKPGPGASVASFKVKDSFANTKKSTFQRKAV